MKKLAIEFCGPECETFLRPRRTSLEHDLVVMTKKFDRLDSVRRGTRVANARFDLLKCRKRVAGVLVMEELERVWVEA